MHQGNIEAIFLNSLRDLNVEVNRPIVPTSIKIIEEKVNDPTAHAVQVIQLYFAPSQFLPFPFLQVVLQQTDGGQESEIVNAKFVIGADGKHQVLYL